jgi:uncharacterized DUF497 family protein
LIGIAEQRCYDDGVQIVWDEPKRLANIQTHGFDFAKLDADFFLAARIVPAKSGRYMAIGRLDDGTVAAVFATLGTEGISVISMRRASRKERALIGD